MCMLIPIPIEEVKFLDEYISLIREENGMGRHFLKFLFIGFIMSSSLGAEESTREDYSFQRIQWRQAATLCEGTNLMLKILVPPCPGTFLINETKSSPLIQIPYLLIDLIASSLRYCGSSQDEPSKSLFFWDVLLKSSLCLSTFFAIYYVGTSIEKPFLHDLNILVSATWGLFCFLEDYFSSPFLFQQESFRPIMKSKTMIPVDPLSPFDRFFFFLKRNP